MTELHKGMDCIVVGGCANGVLLRDMRVDAQFVELKRPDYLKPLASAFQKMPEIAHAKDRYEVHPLSLVNTREGSRGHVFGIAVVESQSLTWAFSQLVISHVENTTNKLLAENVITKQ